VQSSAELRLGAHFSALVYNFDNIFSNWHLYRAGLAMNFKPSQSLECYVHLNRQLQMRSILTLIAVIYSLTSFGQRMTIDEWNEEAKANIRLLPKYGYAVKTEEQKNADKEFIGATLKTIPGKRKASNHLIELGFKYLYNDIKTAMYRFNQAYLVDSANTDIFWGYGAVYMTLGDYKKAQIEYVAGLLEDAKNTHLLTDYGTYFMNQFYVLRPVDGKNAWINLDSAINYMTKSYRIDSKDQNTTFKLSVCYYQKKDCDNAWKYYNECVALGGQPISEDFTTALKEQCKKSN
jgi:Tfp pilus assembly protein PilF